MKLFIPACGDRLVLSKDWTFTLYFEHRNTKFAHERGYLETKPSWSVYEEGQPRYGSRLKRQEITIPSGTVLECDRIYIRAQNKSAVEIEDDYDSITWRIPGQKNSRFWAKLTDCNNLEFELQSDASFKERAKEKAAQPKKMDADAIREALYEAATKKGPHVQWIADLTPEVEALYEDSLKIHKEAYEMYAKDRREYIRRLEESNQKHRMFASGWDSRRETVDDYHAFSKEDFVWEFFLARGTMCAHSKLADGTHVRKFSWQINREAPYNWYRQNTKPYALAGLSLSVATDADDTSIISMKVNPVRKKPNA